MTVWEDTVKVAIRCTFQTVTLVNTLWFRNLGGVSESNAADLANLLTGWYVGGPLQQLQSSIVYQDTTVYDMRSVDSWVVFDDNQQGEQGGVTATPILPLNAAMTVTFQTNRRGRSYRGRNYLSGFPETDAEGIIWNSGVLNAIDTAYTGMGADILSTGYVHVVASGVQAGAPLLVGVTTPVIAYRANARIYKMGGRTA